MTNPLPKDGRLDPKHLAHHNTDAFRSKLKAAQEQEAARQSLLRGEKTPQALAYARFLNAVENDATYGHGKFYSFRSNDDEVARDWPHLFKAKQTQQCAAWPARQERQ